MFLSFQYGLRPTRAQHRALDAILERQRLLCRMTSQRPCGVDPIEYAQRILAA
jgi:hypothetical protein